MRKIIAITLISIAASAAKTKKPDAHPSLLDQYVEQALKGMPAPPEPSPGSLFVRTGVLADGFRDLRASRMYDLVTIVVNDASSAVSSAVSNTSRKSSVNASVTALGGTIKATRPLANLATTSNDVELQGQGTTSRNSALTTTLTAQVTHVLPNGNLVIQGQKEIHVNSEHQTVTIRGIVRPDDLTPTNQIASTQVAMLEVRVTGKGIVNDAVRRPNILYRLLLGLLPF
jgi:flagellar L-ring protein precursor FlgH